MPTGQSTETVTETDPAGTTSPDETLESRTETTSSETETNIEETTTAETVTESGTEPDHDDRDNPENRGFHPYLDMGGSHDPLRIRCDHAAQGEER